MLLFKKIANFMGHLLQNYEYIIGMQIFQDIFETHKQSFISGFSICMTVTLRSSFQGQLSSFWLCYERVALS